jgi:hypothetical protein
MLFAGLAFLGLIVLLGLVIAGVGIFLRLNGLRRKHRD